MYSPWWPINRGKKDCQEESKLIPRERKREAIVSDNTYIIKIKIE